MSFRLIVSWRSRCHSQDKLASNVAVYLRCPPLGETFPLMMTTSIVMVMMMVMMVVMMMMMMMMMMNNGS